jgi:hypothetical protein
MPPPGVILSESVEFVARKIPHQDYVICQMSGSHAELLSFAAPFLYTTAKRKGRLEGRKVDLHGKAHAWVLQWFI